MTFLEAVAVLLAGAAAGTINTVVGSGTLITFPTLLALGVPPVTANVSNTIGLVPGSVRRELQDVMTSRVGVLRHAEGLADATGLLDKLAGAPAELVDLDAWETTNLLTLSSALADAAALREETRGSHWREDFPERDDARWSGHLDVVMRDGATTVTFEPAAPTDGLA